MCLEISLDGGTGRRKGLKIPRSLSLCEFDSRSGHHENAGLKPSDSEGFSPFLFYASEWLSPRGLGSYRVAVNLRFLFYENSMLSMFPTGWVIAAHTLKFCRVTLNFS